MSPLHLNSKRALGVYILLLLACSFLLPIMPQAHAAVGLVYFRAERGDGDSQIKVSWQTETEQDLVAFRVKRNTSNDVASATNVHTEQAQGSATTGGTYGFDDDGLTPGLYFYWLYEVNSSGAETMVQPTTITLPAPGEPTPTATPTRLAATQTSPPTNTQQPTNTPPATPVPTVGQQLNENQPANTPVPTNTPFVPTNTPAGNTLAPAAGDVATNTPIPAASGSTPATAPAAAQEPGTLSTTPEVALVDSASAQGGPVATEAVSADASPISPAAEQPSSVESTQGQAGELAASASTPTVQAVAQAAPAATEAAAAPALAARPTATPRPSSDSAQPSNTSSLLMVIGGGSLCGAVLLVLVGVFVWRRR